MVLLASIIHDAGQLVYSLLVAGFSLVVYVFIVHGPKTVGIFLYCWSTGIVNAS